MVDNAALRKDSEALLGSPVQAAALFVIDIGRLAPTVGGITGAVVADSVTELITDNLLADGLAQGVGYVAGRHAVYASAAGAAGLTPVMILAVTDEFFSLLDWNGNVRSGTGPTMVFARFERANVQVSASKSGPTHHITLTQGDVSIKVQCNLGLLAPGKKEMRDVLAALGVQ